MEASHPWLRARARASEAGIEREGDGFLDTQRDASHRLITAGEKGIQGYLTYKKMNPPRALQ